MVKRPSPGSQAVENAKKEFLNFGDIADDLNIIARCLDIAYNSLVKFPNLQGEVNDLQINVLVLADKSEVTINEYLRASSRVLDWLEWTYQYLYDGKLKIAQDIFKSVSDEANEMASKAEGLQIQYETECSRAKKLLKDVYAEQQKNVDHKEQVSKEKQNITKKIRNLEAEEKRTFEDFKMAEEIFYDAHHREHRAIRAQSDPLKLIVNAFANKYLGTAVFDMSVHADAADRYRMEKEHYYEEMKKMHELNGKIKASIAEFAQHASNCKTESDLADAAVEALKDIGSELKHIAFILQSARNYWESMYKLVNKDFDPDILILLKMALNNEETRNEFLYSEPFQQEIIKTFAKWVAMKEACINFIKRYKLARGKIKEVLLQRLNEKESFARARQVGKELYDDIKYQRKLDYVIKNEL